MPDKFHFSGEVQSGRGIAAKRLTEHAVEIKWLVGEEIVEGSLNLVLRYPLMLSTKNALRFGGGRYLLWPAESQGLSVWLLRWQDAPLHVVELLSSVHLRNSLRLCDGDLITVEMREADRGEVPSLRKLVWAFFWLGRRQWSYTRYYSLTRPWCRRLGATQGECSRLIRAPWKELGLTHPNSRDR